MATRPAVAILDVNETISDLSGLRRAFEEVGADAQLVDTWFASTLRDGMALSVAGDFAGFVDVGRGVLATLLNSPEAAPAIEKIVSALTDLGVHPDIQPGLEQLNRAGLRVATLTNGSSASTVDLLRRARLEGFVEANLDVSAVARWKPHPEPYRYACRQLGVVPAETVMIAVHPWDVHGAKRAGLQAAWLNRASAPYPGVFQAPDATARDLPALTARLLG